MPWHKQAMKDATTGDMPRGGGNNLISADFRMGQPNPGNAGLSTSEYIGCVKPTRGTEASKYPVRESLIMIS